MKARKPKQPKVYKDLYVMMIGDEILTPQSIKKYCPGYGTYHGHYGWKPPKKVYYTAGHARSAYTRMPDKLKEVVTVRLFQAVGDIVPMDKPDGQY